MKRLLLAACVLAVVGCGHTDRANLTVQGPEPMDTNTWLVETVADAQVRAGVIAQHTLYPYHFVTGGAALNDLGRRDLEILADHYRQYPGVVNVRQGDASPELYERRLATVMQGLRSAGADASGITATDGMPGGDGLPTERVITILRLPANVGESTGYSAKLEWKNIPNEPAQ